MIVSLIMYNSLLCFLFGSYTVRKMFTLLLVEFISSKQVTIYFYSQLNSTETGSIGKVIPPLLVLYIGQEISLTCYSSSKPTWYHSKKDISTQYYSNDGYTVKISNGQFSDGGIYSCTGTYVNGTTFFAFSEVHVGSKLHESVKRHSLE